MIQAKEYSCYVADDNTLVIILPCVSKKDVSDAKILYDGQEHALLYRNDEDVTILDYLNEDMRPLLAAGSSVVVFEVDMTAQDVVRDYDVPILHVSKLPVFTLEES